MLVTLLGLAWLNDLYLKITGGEIIETGYLPIRRHGPLEPMLAVCFVVGLAALIFWFFVLAEYPSRGVFG